MAAGGTETVTLQLRTLWLSGLHLGSGACKCNDLLNFLAGVRADTIFLVGDIIDSSCATTRFPADDAETWLRLLQFTHSGTRVVYLPGACDSDASRHAGQAIGGIEYRDSAVHVTAAGRRLLVVHGIGFDAAVRAGTTLANYSPLAYPWLLRADARFGALHSALGEPFAPAAVGVRRRLERAREYRRRFEAEARRQASGGGYDGIVCGHLHQPALGDDNDILYAGSGDWIEHDSALAEFPDGSLIFLTHDRSVDRHMRGDSIHSVAA